MAAGGQTEPGRLVRPGFFLRFFARPAGSSRRTSRVAMADEIRAPSAAGGAFRAEAERKPRSWPAEFLHFLLHNKKWWLIPIVVVLLLAGALVLIGGSGIAPFIYTLF